MRGDNRSRALTVSAGSTPLIFDLATRGKVRNAKRGSRGHVDRTSFWRRFGRRRLEMGR